VNRPLVAQTRVQEGNASGILHLGNGDEPESLDPHLTTGVPEYNIISGLMEGLLREDPKTLKPTPGVATHWEVSEDGKTYVFHLRPDAKWSNGDPVTAEDFVFSFRRILSPKLAAEYAYMLHILKNAKAYNEGRLDDPSAIGVRAADAHTLVIELENPAPYFLGMLNHHSYYPVHAATLRKHGDPENRDNPWARPGNYVGNGPFTLAEWQINQHIHIAKSDTYWNKDKVRLNAIFFYPIQDEQTEERMFRAGLLHKTENVPLTRIDRYRREDKALFRSHSYLTTYYYLFNTSRKPFDDARVRRALSLALQREVITERVLKAGQLPALWFTPPGTAGFEPSQKLTEDLDEARRLLAEAGYPGGKGFPKFSILYNTRESHRSIAQVIQQMWKQNLGIECELVNQEWQVYMVSRREKNFDVARAGWSGDYADPHNFLDLHLSGGGNNHSGWGDPAYDELIAKATAERDNAKRFALYDEAEAILLRDMPVLPIYWYTRNYLIAPSVKGWDTNILDRHDYSEVWLDPNAK
jgi:oligopeptide transport system substrate-binding protein